MNESIARATEYLKARLPGIPDVAIVLGSGLGNLMDTIAEKLVIDYKDIPGFSATTIPGHTGQLIVGMTGGKLVLAMKGRFHYYEGHDTAILTFPVRVFYALGIRKLILTNAAGGVNIDFRPGDLMVLDDHIGFLCPSPLRGNNMDEFGPRFPDMSEVYSKRLRSLAIGAAEELGTNIRTWVYFFFRGPQFETPSEIAAARVLGADAVGMSTVPEAIVARHMGMETLAISTITNMAAGILSQPLTHTEVLETGKAVEQKFSQLINKIIEKL